jgi:PAS domain S-box-containing protein
VLLDESPDGLIALTRDGPDSIVEPRARDMFGYAAEEAVGRASSRN